MPVLVSKLEVFCKVTAQQSVQCESNETTLKLLVKLIIVKVFNKMVLMIPSPSFVEILLS